MKAWVNLGRQRPAADLAAAFEHQWFPPGLGEIERRRQCVVARADDDRVVHLHDISVLAQAGPRRTAGYRLHARRRSLSLRSDDGGVETRSRGPVARADRIP